MSVLILVRHAQASFFHDDYDRLSPLGEQQARLLGEFWVTQGLQFHAVYTGPRTRQRRTADLAGEVYRQAGLAWPEHVVLDDGDEYDLSGMMGLAPELARANAEFEALSNAYQQSEGELERLRTFQAMFEALLHHWQGVGQAFEPATADKNVCPTLECWPVFRQRVQRALGLIRQQPGRGRRIALFTSGGFIGTAVQSVLTAPDRAALELNWRLRNCSLTELVFTRDRISLDSFNTVPHLTDSSLWTYR